MRKRKRGRSRGRKVILRVMKVPNKKDEQFHYLTALRTRVKKTRWQKISLPVTLIQSMLDSKDNALNLRISCKHCGRMVRPVLFRREDKIKNLKNGKIRKRKWKGKGKRRRRRRRMRNKRTNGNNRIQPFLVISTRYRHTFQQSWDFKKKSNQLLCSQGILEDSLPYRRHMTWFWRHRVEKDERESFWFVYVWERPAAFYFLFPERVPWFPYV